MSVHAGRASIDAPRSLASAILDRHLHGQEQGPALPLDQNRHRLAWLERINQFAELLQAGDLVIVDLQDDVAGAQACGGGRAVGDVFNQHAAVVDLGLLALLAGGLDDRNLELSIELGFLSFCTPAHGVKFGDKRFNLFP